MTCHVEYPSRSENEFAEDVEILEVSYDLASLNPFGPFKSGSVTVRGLAIPVWPTMMLDSEYGKFALRFCANDFNFQEPSIRLENLNVDVFYRSEPTPSTSRRHSDVESYQPLFLLPVLRSTISFDIEGIVLRAVEGETNTFSRVGIILGYPRESVTNVFWGLCFETAERRIFDII